MTEADKTAIREFIEVNGWSRCGCIDPFPTSNVEGLEVLFEDENGFPQRCNANYSHVLGEHFFVATNGIYNGKRLSNVFAYKLVKEDDKK